MYDEEQDGMVTIRFKGGSIPFLRKKDLRRAGFKFTGASGEYVCFFPGEEEGEKILNLLLTIDRK